MGLSKGFPEWLWPTERRRARRKMALPLAAYYWDGSEPRPRQVKNISLEGMYLLTDQRWYLKTMLQMTLVRIDRRPNDPAYSIRVAARVVRSGEDGVGFAFVLPARGSRQSKGFFETETTKADLNTFLAGLELEVTDKTPRMRAESLRVSPLFLLI
jgi:hypothetical protein